MSQPSNDSSHDPAAEPKLAQVLPFERPRSELQRAVQMRALESIELQRARANTRPNPIRRIAMFALALIPVGLLFIAIDGLLRVFHHMNDLYNSPEANTAPAPETEADITQSEPGVVLLQPPKNLRTPEPPESR
jgi:hypothetical protein